MTISLRLMLHQGARPRGRILFPISSRREASGSQKTFLVGEPSVRQRDTRTVTLNLNLIDKK